MSSLGYYYLFAKCSCNRLPNFTCCYEPEISAFATRMCRWGLTASLPWGVLKRCYALSSSHFSEKRASLQQTTDLDCSGVCGSSEILLLVSTLCGYSHFGIRVCYLEINLKQIEFFWSRSFQAVCQSKSSYIKIPECLKLWESGFPSAWGYASFHLDKFNWRAEAPFPTS